MVVIVKFESYQQAVFSIRVKLHMFLLYSFALIPICHENKNWGTKTKQKKPAEVLFIFRLLSV